MITINATSDTTLHTAGKYCAEDILVKVPAGDSSSSGSVETITITYSSMPDPGTEIYYIDETMTIQHTTVSINDSYTMVKGTIFIVTGYMSSKFGGCTSICGNSVCKAFYAYPSSE